jgi:hypothetical protein
VVVSRGQDEGHGAAVKSRRDETAVEELHAAGGVSRGPLTAVGDVMIS